MSCLKFQEELERRDAEEDSSEWAVVVQVEDEEEMGMVELFMASDMWKEKISVLRVRMLERDEGAKEDEEEREVPMRRVGTGRTDVKRIAIKSWKTTAAAKAPPLKQVRKATIVRPEGKPTVRTCS